MLRDRLNKVKINFIVGHARSGTTLLMVILNQHKNCISTPEIHHFVYFYKKYRHVNLVSSQLITDYKTYINRFLDLKRSPLIGPFNETLFDQLKIGEPITYAEITKLAYLSLYGEKGTSNEINVIVDKNPYYTFHIDKIFEVFPDAQVLATVRDYRAYILSNRQSQLPLVKPKSVYYYAMAWNCYIRNIEQAKNKYGNQFKVLRYEDLVESKDLKVKSIVEYFGLSYSDKLLDFYVDMKEKITANKELVNQHERIMKKMYDLSLPINPQRVNSWKEKLSPQEIEMADVICSGMAKSLGYFPIQPMSISQKLYHRILALPAFVRVKAFEVLNSPALFFYSTYSSAEKRRKHFK